MRLLVSLVVACATVTLASAESRADLTLTWFEHMHSSKGTEQTVNTTITVTGTKIHYVWTRVGPDPDKPRNKNKDVSGEIKNDKAIADALAKLDKIKVTPKLAAAAAKDDDQTACLTRGKTTRCESGRGETITPGYHAMLDLTEVLQQNVDDQIKAQK